jgi:HEAT repeat protein
MAADIKSMIMAGDWNAISEIDKFENKQKILPDLLIASKSSDSEVRYIAASGLLFLKDSSVTDAFVRLLSDHRQEIRATSLRGMQSRTDTKILPSLLPHLENEDPDVRGEIALLIGKYGNSTLLLALKKAIEKENNKQSFQMMIKAMARLGDTVAKYSICEQLSSKNSDVVLQGVKDLEYINDPALVIYLLPALKNTTDVYNLGIPDDPKGPFARICDISVTAASKLLGSDFPFPLNGRESFSDEEINIVINCITPKSRE